MDGNGSNVGDVLADKIADAVAIQGEDQSALMKELAYRYGHHDSDRRKIEEMFVSPISRVRARLWIRVMLWLLSVGKPRGAHRATRTYTTRMIVREIARRGKAEARS